MSKYDKKLKPYKEEFKTAISELIYDTLDEHVDKMDSDAYFNKHMSSLEKFQKRVCKYEKRYGHVEFNKWLADVMNEIKLGDLMYKYDMSHLED